jgi:hypothetical protein
MKRTLAVLAAGTFLSTGAVVVSVAPAQAVTTCPTLTDAQSLIGISAGANLMIGTAGNDVLVGTSGRDIILGLGGNDVITGAAGDDIVAGGPGDDVLYGGAGSDCVFGGDGDDRVFNSTDLASNDDDYLDGGPGYDAGFYWETKDWDHVEYAWYD